MLSWSRCPGQPNDPDCGSGSARTGSRRRVPPSPSNTQSEGRWHAGQGWNAGGSDTLPALFTRMSQPPSSLSTLFSAGSSAARSATSTLSATDGAPRAFNSESTRWFFSSLRSKTQRQLRLQPSRGQCRVQFHHSRRSRPPPGPVKSNHPGVSIKHSPSGIHEHGANQMVSVNPPSGVRVVPVM